ncbi:MAG: fumarylacetoacetate hydrolase family protein [Tannerella sp.]|jgi:2-keto-4-pentenoate hydratase/2-oxohepta-3-ene-1,7-dioic acid hydratase in catechol pathway|nr:fumarylacetoacetate hydrolase family protein [Tannerella sp.]
MKIFAVGMNYAAHNNEMHNPPAPPEPVIFMKGDLPLRDGKPFFIPDFSSEIHYETELVIKINKLGKNIAEKFAHRYYEEVTVGIDFTARDLQTDLRKQGLPWEISKSFDYSAATGRFLPLATLGNINQLTFHLTINEQTVQQAHTSQMIFPVNHIIAHISRFFMLRTGDLIYTGTPAGTGRIKIGDHLQGYLENQKLLDFYIR